MLLDSDLLRRRDKAVNAVVRGEMRKLTQTKDGVVTCTDEIVDLAGLSDIDPYKYIYGYVRRTLLLPPSQLPPLPQPSLPQPRSASADANHLFSHVARFPLPPALSTTLSTLLLATKPRPPPKPGSRCTSVTA